MTRLLRSAVPALAATALLTLPTEVAAMATAPSLSLSPALLFGFAIFAPTLLLAVGVAAGLLVDLLRRSEVVWPA
jgi:hypothetical protein